MSAPVSALAEEAARVCEETVRFHERKRGALRTPADPEPEFSDAAFGLAAEVANAIASALRAARLRVASPAEVWQAAGEMLRAGYESGQRIVVARSGSA